MITKDNYIGIDEILERLNTAPGYIKNDETAKIASGGK